MVKLEKVLNLLPKKVNACENCFKVATGKKTSRYTFLHGPFFRVKQSKLQLVLKEIVLLSFEDFLIIIW